MHGTRLERTHVPLRTWFGAVFLAAASGRDVAAVALSRQLRLPYQSAWQLAKRIRDRSPREWTML
jgi:hypothetical protein